MATRAKGSSGDVLSPDEYTLLTESFKDEKFRQLLCEYAREVNDPQNRKQYEKEVIQYEKERGVEAVFVHPSPGFAVLLQQDGGAPAFVNICSSDAVQRPDVEPVGGGTESCHKWSLPHAVSRPRREVLGLGRREGQQPSPSTARPGLVYDVVFHPEALLLALQSPLMRQTLINTAIDSLKKHFSVKTGKVEEVEQEYVGLPAQAVIKRKMGEKHLQSSEQSSAYKDHRTNSAGDNGYENVNKNEVIRDKEREFIKPMYKLKYVRKMDIQDYSLQLIPQCVPAWQPQALELEVSLPGVSRASQVNANVWEQSVLLTTESDPKYKLELPLRYPVDEDLSAAKFDVSTRKLTLTLSVVASSKTNDKLGSQGQSPPSDSGIECEFDYRTNGDSDNVSEASVSSQEDGAKDVMGDAGGEEEDSVFEPPQSEHQLKLAPAYLVQQTRENLVISLCCGNVLPSSIKAEQADDTNAWIELSSIGGGQTTVYYSLKVDVGPNKIGASGLSHRVEEGKVVLVLQKAVAGPWETCRIGHGDALTPVTLPPVAAADNEEKSKRETTTEEKQDDSKSCMCMPRTPRMSRTVSMCETEAGHPFRLRGPTCSWPRGILKHRTRSLSESQVGAFSTSAALESASSSHDIEVLEDKQRYVDDDEEEGEESVEESLASSLGEKKSVRFNEVVSRQLFRSNSSILGQRAKNQRKAIRKRKSQARKDSESEKSDTGINASESPSGESDLTTDAATDDDTDVTTSNTGEGDDIVDKDAKDIQNNNTRNADKEKLNVSGNVLQSLTAGYNDNDVCQLMTNKNNGGMIVLNNISKEDEEDSHDFIIKTSKKKKRKNKKNKLPSFEPTNSLIFQLDMDK